MTPEQITEAKARMAKFTGMEFRTITYPNGITHHEVEKDFRGSKSWVDANYDTDWNWLMELVEAIMELSRPDGTRRVHVVISIEGCDTYECRPDGKYGNTISCHPQSDSGVTSLKDAVFRACNGVLLWLEKQQG